MKSKKPIEYPFVQKTKFGTVRIYRNGPTDTPHYVVSWVDDTGRRRKLFTEESQAHQRAEEILEDLKKGAVLRRGISSEKASYLNEWERLLKEKGKSLGDVVQAFLQHEAKESAKKITASDACKEYLATFEKPTDDPHFKTARSILGKFSRAFGKTLDCITIKELDEYLKSTSTSGRTRNNHLSYLRTFFRWAQEYGKYIPDGPLEINKIKKYPTQVIDPRDVLMTPEDLKKLLQKAPEDIMPSIAIGAFAGVRNAEIGRLTWENVHFDSKFIELGPKITKTKRRRTALMSKNLIAWLNSYTGSKKGPILPFPKGIFKKRRRAAQAAGVEWKKNALRKGYISYQMAIARSSEKVAEQCGNSSTMVQESYKGLVSRESANQWFAIFPKKV